MNGQAIKAWKRKNLQIHDVKLDEDRRQKVKKYVGNFLRNACGYNPTIKKWKSWPEIIYDIYMGHMVINGDEMIKEDTKGHRQYKLK